MRTNETTKHSNRIVIEVAAGIPNYLVQEKKRILFFEFWSTVRERNNRRIRKMYFDTVEQAKSYIKERLA